MTKETSRPEAAFVLLLMQATLWAIAGLSAFPFVLAGEVFMFGLGLASILLAALACILGVGLVKRRRRARRWAIALEVTCLVGSLLQLTLPIGANHGPVSLMTNVGLPLAVIVLLRGKRMRAAFDADAALKRQSRRLKTG
jgi:cytochrome c biogenesis factor